MHYHSWPIHWLRTLMYVVPYMFSFWDEKQTLVVPLLSAFAPMEVACVCVCACICVYVFVCACAYACTCLCVRVCFTSYKLISGGLFRWCFFSFFFFLFAIVEHCACDRAAADVQAPRDSHHQRIGRHSRRSAWLSVNIYIYICVCIVCMCMHVCAHVCVCECVLAMYFSSLFLCRSAWLSAYIYMCVHVCACVCAHVRACIYIYVCVHVFVCMRVCVSKHFFLLFQFQYLFVAFSQKLLFFRNIINMLAKK